MFENWNQILNWISDIDEYYPITMGMVNLGEDDILDKDHPYLGYIPPLEEPNE